MERPGRPTTRKPTPTGPWDLDTAAQIEWCQRTFGFDPLGVIADDPAIREARSVSFVLPHDPVGSVATTDFLCAADRVLGPPPGGFMPGWDFFCRTALDVGELPHSGDRLADSPELEVVRGRLEGRLLSEVLVLRLDAPDVFEALMSRLEPGFRSVLASPAPLRGALADILGVDRVAVGAPRIPVLATSVPALGAPVGDVPNEGESDSEADAALFAVRELSEERRRSRALRGWAVSR